MSKRIIVGAGALVVLAIAAALWASRPERAQWTTSSEEALEEYLAGRAAIEKLYHLEATEHLRRAVERDPDFFAARALLSQALAAAGQKEAAAAERERALAADPSRLSDRERRMLELGKLRAAGDQTRVLEAMERMAKTSPGEPEITRSLASHHFALGNLDTATRWSEATLKVAPNDALSYNMLGYIEMSRGRFAESEAHFRRYAYIAPEQANPHDSLGELFILTGRWEDAEAELARALELNPRFYPAWQHRARLEAVRGHEAAALQALERWVEMSQMPAEKRETEEFVLRFWTALSRGDEAAALALAARPPAGASPSVGFARVVAAWLGNDPATARSVLAAAEAASRKIADAASNGKEMGVAEAELAGMRGFALLAEGRRADAVAAFAVADRALNWGPDQGLFKLVVGCGAVNAMVGAGRLGEARERLAALERVNARFAWLEQCRKAVAAGR